MYKSTKLIVLIGREMNPSTLLLQKAATFAAIYVQTCLCVEFNLVVTNLVTLINSNSLYKIVNLNHDKLYQKILCGWINVNGDKHNIII